MKGEIFFPEYEKNVVFLQEQNRMEIPYENQNRG